MEIDERKPKKGSEELSNNIEQISCNMSASPKEHMSEGLITIGKEELQDIIDTDGKAELVCHFCNKKYEFSKHELEDLIKDMN